MKLNQIYLGDAFKLIQQIDDKSADLIIVDPTYNFNPYTGRDTGKNIIAKRRYIENLNDLDCCAFNPLEFLNLIRPKMKRFYGYFFCNKKLLKAYLDFADYNKLTFDVLVMAKNNPIPAYKGHHLPDLEYIVLIRESKTYFSQNEDFDNYRKFYLKSCKQGIHPAEKPAALLERFIKISSRPNDLILDCFAGSGSTLIAAQKLKRNFIGFEIDKRYFDMINERLMNSKNQLDLFNE